MELNQVLIKYENKSDGKISISWNLNPDNKIEDLFYAFDTAKSALTELVNKKAKEEGIKTEKTFLKWIKGKSIKDITQILNN